MQEALALYSDQCLFIFTYASQCHSFNSRLINLRKRHSPSKRLQERDDLLFLAVCQAEELFPLQGRLSPVL